MSTASVTRVRDAVNTSSQRSVLTPRSKDNIQEPKHDLPGTPTQCDGRPEDALATETQRQLLAQQKRIARFSQMLSEFRDHKANAIAEKQRAIGATDTAVFTESGALSDSSDDEEDEVEAIKPLQQKVGVVTPMKQGDGGTPNPATTPLTRKNIFDASVENPLNRTPLSLPRSKAWKLSGLDRPQLNGQVRGHTHMDSPILPAQRVKVGTPLRPVPISEDEAIPLPKATDYILASGTPTVERLRGSAELVEPTVGTPYTTPASHVYAMATPKVVGNDEYVELAATPGGIALHAAREAAATAAADLAAAPDEYVEVTDEVAPAVIEDQYIEALAHNPEPGYIVAVGNGSAAATPELEEGLYDTAYDAQQQQQMRPMEEDAESGDAPQLHTYAAQGNMAMLQEHFKSGDNVNGVDAIGRSLLMYALQFGMVECAAWIIKQGGNVNHCANDASTALHYAAHCGSSAQIKLLMQAGADPRRVDDEGRSALHWAMFNTNQDVLAQLLATARPEDVNAQDGTGLTPAMWAAFYGNKGHLVQLHKAGAELVGAADELGRSAIHLACASGNGSNKCLKMLLNYQSSFVQDKAGKSAIHSAAESGNHKAIKHIVHMRPQAVHDIDYSGRTPLHWAAACNQGVCVLKLLKYGAHTQRADVNGKMPSDYAEARAFEPIMRVLASHVQSTQFDAPPRLGPAIASTSSKSLGDDSAVAAMGNEAKEILRLLSTGTYLSKFSNLGEGPLHKRYFWIDLFSGELCWTKKITSIGKTKNGRDVSDVSTASLKKVVPELGYVVQERRDYDPSGKHKWGFTLKCKYRDLDVIAPSELVYKIWVEGLRCLREYATTVVATATPVADEFVAETAAFCTDC